MKTKAALLAALLCVSCATTQSAGTVKSAHGPYLKPGHFNQLEIDKVISSFSEAYANEFRYYPTKALEGVVVIFKESECGHHGFHSFQGCIAGEVLGHVVTVGYNLTDTVATTALGHELGHVAQMHYYNENGHSSKVWQRIQKVLMNAKLAP